MKKILFALVLCCLKTWISCENTETYLTSSHSQVHRAISKHRKVRYQKGFNTPKTYKLGQYAPQIGGVVIYLTDDKQHGLVAAIENAFFPSFDGQPTAQWSTLTATTNATSDSQLPPTYTTSPYKLNYSGGKNQDAIEKISNYKNLYPAFSQAATWQENQKATRVRIFKDWFLPGIPELRQMFDFKDIIDAAAEKSGVPITYRLENNSFWSSQQTSETQAKAKNFENGAEGGNTKTTLLYVRYVRAF